MTNLTILLVEDNEVNVLIARKFLERWPVTLDVATNGKMAVDMIQCNSFDLVLMDLQMPIMDGYEATRCIRQLADPQKSRIPVIALTASAVLEEQEKVMAVGMNDYITKPIDPDILSKKIAKQLEGSHVAQ